MLQFLPFFILLCFYETWYDGFAEMNRSVEAIDKMTKIVKKGNDVIVECHLCDVHQLKWTYKSIKETQEDIVENNNIIRNENHGKGRPWFNINNNSNCTYNLALPKIQLDSAGVYSCWEGSVAKRITHIIVINATESCFVEPKLSDSEIIRLKQNDSLIMKCHFQYSADESCIVTPIWTDLTRHRNFSIPDDDFEVNMDDKHAWIHFKPGADVASGTHFNLSFAFNCSFSNNSQYKTIRQGRYDFGHVPFTFLIEDKKVIGNGANFLLTVGISMVAAVVAVVLLFLFTWKVYKLFCANLRRTSNETASEIPMGDRYNRIRKDLRYKDVRIYEDIVDNTYATIDNPLEPVHGGNYILAVDQ